MWQRGRQNSEGSYYKLALMPAWLSRLLKADLYLLRFSEGCVVPKHTDPAPEGYVHVRWNMMLRGEGWLTWYGKTMTVPLYMKPLDNNWFYANTVEHDFVTEEGCLVLSFGRLRRMK